MFQALARAVYSDCSTLICDDIFNDLDVKTASEIFANVFGRKGLLRQEGRTVILATHSGMMKRLNHWYL